MEVKIKEKYKFEAIRFTDTDDSLEEVRSFVPGCYIDIEHCGDDIEGRYRNLEVWTVKNEMIAVSPGDYILKITDKETGELKFKTLFSKKFTRYFEEK